MFLFQLASQHGAWLAVRQAVTARNIANADTPGYRASDVTPFANVLDRTGIALAATQPGHMALADDDSARIGTVQEEADDESFSGNDVMLETELAKAGDIGRMQAFDTGLTRVFQRLLLSSVKS